MMNPLGLPTSVKVIVEAFVLIKKSHDRQKIILNVIDVER